MSHSTDLVVDAVALRREFRVGANVITALVDATCQIRAGQQIALTGPSGSGKSTLLHILAGIDHQTTGTITWPCLVHASGSSVAVADFRFAWSRSLSRSRGQPRNFRDAPPGDISSLRPGPIGVVFQAPSLLPPLTVLENVALPLLLKGSDARTATDRAHEALVILELDNLANKLPEELSGGQSQRVAVARVLAGEPALVLADEPTGQLDHDTSSHVIDVLLAASDASGAALVINTHDAAVSDRFAIRWTMRDGRLTVADKADTADMARTQVGTSC